MEVAGSECSCASAAGGVQGVKNLPAFAGDNGTIMLVTVQLCSLYKVHTLTHMVHFVCIRAMPSMSCRWCMWTDAVVSSEHSKKPKHLLLLLQALKRVIEVLWWNNLRSPATIRSMLQLVYANKAAIDEDLLQRIVEATMQPAALDAFTSIMLAPRTQLNFNEMLDAVACPICMAYGGWQLDRSRPVRGMHSMYAPTD